MAGVTLGWYRINPICWFPREGKIEVIRSMSVSLICPSYRSRSDADEVACRPELVAGSTSALNEDILATYPTNQEGMAAYFPMATRGATMEYLIITSQAMKEAIANYTQEDL